jgi:hypothetical protein
MVVMDSVKLAFKRVYSFLGLDDRVQRWSEIYTPYCVIDIPAGSYIEKQYATKPGETFSWNFIERR